MNGRKNEQEHLVCNVIVAIDEGVVELLKRLVMN